MMKNRKIKLASILMLTVGMLYSGKALADDCGFLCMSYQKKFEEALRKAEAKGESLLIMDFQNYNAWEDLVQETVDLKQKVLEDFESFSKYKLTYQEEDSSSDVKLSLPSNDDDPTNPTVYYADSLKTWDLIENKMAVDENAIADLKLAGIMQNEYRLASASTSGSDAIVADSMEFSYSKVMDNYFRGVAKTDVREISLQFINKFLKEPCPKVEEEEAFRLRRLMLYRETIKEAAGLGYYAQVQSLDWSELLQDLEGDIKKYTKDGDINKAVRINFLLRQFMNRLFTIYIQSKAAQNELLAVKRMFENEVILYRKSLSYAKGVMEDAKAAVSDKDTVSNK